MSIQKIIKVKNQKGFSLIEMMVVVVILGLIVLGLVTFFTGGVKSWVAGQSQLEAQRNARQAMDRMVREIREGKNVISGSNSSKIKVYYLDSFAKDPITYQLNGTILEREVNSSSNPVINNVQSLAFKYLDSLGAEVVPPLTPENKKALEISKVHINLEVDVDKDDNPDVTLNTDVKLRNYGYINE